MSGKAKARGEPVKAFSYLRTSSATNVGADKDSEMRQREAIDRFAQREGFTIVREFRDPAVSGKDAIDTRPGFKDLLNAIAANGTRVVIVESPDRFARHLLTQEAGIALLVQLGVRVLTSHGDDLTDSDDEFRVAMRQVMGIFSQLERTRLVKKLAGARARQRAQGKKVEGRKTRAERLLAKKDEAGAKQFAEAVALAKRLHRRSPVPGERRSLREIAAELSKAGHMNERGRPYHPQSIRQMLED